MKYQSFLFNKVQTQSKMPYDEIMVDIETLSTRPNATIMSIGAIKFDRKSPIKKLEEMEQFYIKITRESCEALGMRTDPETVAWWNSQDEAIRYEALENQENRVEIKDALRQFKKWIGRSSIVWGNGDDFDCVILDQAYKECSMETPWKFWNTRDVRTVLDLTKIRACDLPANEKHHPVHDCYRQIWGVKTGLERAGLNK